MKKTLLFLALLIFFIATLSGCGKCDHSYLSECATVCQLCGTERSTDTPHSFDETPECEPRTCKGCGFVDERYHSYETLDEEKPTLFKDGKKTEKCTVCKKYLTTKIPKLTAKELGMPAVYITDLGGTTPIKSLEKYQGEIKVKLDYISANGKAEDFSCYTKIKVQGASSSGYEKKNYTVKFFSDEELTKKHKVDFGWGKENQYCLKANYVDASHARNIIGARLSASVVKTRTDLDQNLAVAPNYGLIDGFPVLVYINDTFHGLYSLNIPKDHWQFGMDGGEDTRQAILMAANWTDSVRLMSPIGRYFVDSGWDVEYCSTNDDKWIKESFNELISLLNCGNGEKIKKELPTHLDIGAAIDNFILTFVLNAADNEAKNILWATYDGVKWIPSMYDMDATFGMFWNGLPIDEVNANSIYPTVRPDGSFKLTYSYSQMYYVLLTYYPDEVEARYNELRNEIITIENISKLFADYQSQIHDEAFKADDLKWSPPFSTENRNNMCSQTEKQLARLDDFFEKFNK